MLDRIFSFIEQGPPAPAPSQQSAATRREVAAAALLVEAARLDQRFDEAERKTITRIVETHFSLAPEEAGELVALAERTERRNYHPWAFIQAVKRSFSDAERKDVLQALWEVAYADGALHKFEIHLVDHVCEQLGLSREECEKARIAAKNKAA